MSARIVAGRLSVHRDGYGFVAPERPLPGVAGDIFIGARSAARAMHGDTVEARLIRRSPDGRAEGEIVRVVKRAHPTVVGEFHAARGGCYVVPHDWRLRERILIPNGDATLDGATVEAEITEFPRGDSIAAGRVIDVLGRPGDFGLDVAIVIRKHQLRREYPEEALAEARALPAAVTATDLAGRRDFRGCGAVTIDGETARDFDDAVAVERLTNGNFALQVHIADVSHYVRPGSAIDREAQERATSVYFPDRALHMLPPELATGICSLKPGVDRLVFSALLEVDPRGEVVRQEFARGVIRSHARLTYTAVAAGLESATPDPRLALMRDLALALQGQREQRGAIDFDLPEPLILLDADGVMTGIARTPRNIAHRIIEEFMLAANEAVAAHLEASGLPALYRIHEPPDPQRVLEFEETAARFGHSLGFGAFPVKRHAVVTHTSDGRKLRRDIVRADERVKITPRMYQRLVAKLAGRPEERILNYLMLRSMRQARYAPDNVGHFGLAAKTYTHFTSPIRRYPDLIVHRLLAGGAVAGLPEIAEHSSEMERRADGAERELLEWKKVQFMVERVGDEFPALIISVTKAGFFVELDELFVEGLVPIDTLPGERWLYQENARQIAGARSRRAFKLGQRVNVRLDRVDGVERRLYFSVV